MNPENHSVQAYHTVRKNSPCIHIIQTTFKLPPHTIHSQEWLPSVAFEALCVLLQQRSGSALQASPTFPLLPARPQEERIEIV